MVLVLITASATIIILCKIINKKQQNQLQQEVYYSVVGPPTLSERNANTSPKLSTHPIESAEEFQTKNPAYGVNIAAMTELGIGKAASEQRELNPERRDTMLLSSNPAYGTNVSM